MNRSPGGAAERLESRVLSPLRASGKRGWARRPGVALAFGSLHPRLQSVAAPRLQTISGSPARPASVSHELSGTGIAGRGRGKGWFGLTYFVTGSVPR